MDKSNNSSSRFHIRFTRLLIELAVVLILVFASSVFAQHKDTMTDERASLMVEAALNKLCGKEYDPSLLNDSLSDKQIKENFSETGIRVFKEIQEATGIPLSYDLQEMFQEIEALCYLKTRLEVQSAEKVGDNYEVVVKVYPLQVFPKDNTFRDCINETMAESVSGSLTDEQIYNASLRRYLRMAISYLDNPSYDSGRIITVSLLRDNDGYTISGSSAEQINDVLFSIDESEKQEEHVSALMARQQLQMDLDSVWGGSLGREIISDMLQTGINPILQDWGDDISLSNENVQKLQEATEAVFSAVDYSFGPVFFSEDAYDVQLIIQPVDWLDAQMQALQDWYDDPETYGTVNEAANSAISAVLSGIIEEAEKSDNRPDKDTITVRVNIDSDGNLQADDNYPELFLNAMFYPT